MKAKVRLTQKFKPLYKNGRFISLWNHEWKIIEEIKAAIYQKSLYSHLFIDADFYCVVWWDDELENWCGEIYTKVGYVYTYICASIEEMRNEFLDDYYFHLSVNVS